MARRKDDSNTKSSRVQTLALTTDASGKVRHDAVVKQQHGTGTLVQSSHTDLLSKKFTEEQLMKPSEEEVMMMVMIYYQEFVTKTGGGQGGRDARSVGGAAAG